MAATLTVSDAVQFCSPMIKQQRLYVNNLQPALGIAQIILNRTLGPPFIWRFNRGTFQIAITTIGGTDYVVSLPTLGRIETQWLLDGSGNIFELKGDQSIAKVSTSARPTKVAPVYDDNTGNITFRFNKVPNASYTALFDHQQKATLITSPAMPFGPIPDEFAHIFLTGFLSWAGMLVNDARFPIWEKEFLGSLLGAQDGLDAQAKAIFLGEWMEFSRTVQRNQGLSQAGGQGLQT